MAIVATCMDVVDGRAYDYFTGETVTYLGPLYYLTYPPTADTQCEGCPEGMAGEWREQYGAYLCASHLAECDRAEWRDYEDNYTGPTFYEYEEESW